MKITKEIGIDLGHRVAQHDSKCYNLHGHRYKIIAEVEGELKLEGSENGMVMDFGFLKEILMEFIDKKYDHSFTVWKEDKKVIDFLKTTDFKYNIIDKTPTAENLAELWYNEMKDEVIKRTDGKGRLSKVIVFETPTSSAEYSG